MMYMVFTVILFSFFSLQLSKVEFQIKEVDEMAKTQTSLRLTGWKSISGFAKVCVTTGCILDLSHLSIPRR